MNHTGHDKEDGTVDTLNTLLRGELSAIESYDKAMPAVRDQPSIRGDLQDCRASHESRVERIRLAILQLGGQPAGTSGAWGAFAKAVAGGAESLGWKAAVRALEEGEDHGLKEYKDALPKMNEGLQRLISKELYPQQEYTHNIIATIKRSASA
jgi:hypothetical protein